MAYCLEIDGYGARQILKYCVTHVKSWMDSLVGREFKFKLNFHEKKLAVIFFFCPRAKRRTPDRPITDGWVTNEDRACECYQEGRTVCIEHVQEM